MDEIDIKRFGMATGATFAILNILCLALLMILGTETLVMLANGFMHGLDISPLVKTNPLTLGQILLGIIETFAVGFLAGACIAGIYNFSLKR